MELFDDLFAVTYREDSSSKKRRSQYQGASFHRNQIEEIVMGQEVSYEEYLERIEGLALAKYNIQIRSVSMG